MKRATWTGSCNTCYSARRSGVSKKEASAWCTSHMKVYGHDCTLLPDRTNPPLAVFGNPRSGIRLSSRAYALAYRHAEDGRDYKHDFKPGVHIELLADGSVRLFRRDGKKLWGDF